MQTETEIDIFVRREGHRDPVHLDGHDGITVAAIMALIDPEGRLIDYLLFEEEADEPLHHQHGLRHDKRTHYLHHSRCRHVEVVVRYPSKPEIEHKFGPGSTVARIKAWAERKFEIDAVDGAKLSLQIAGTTDRPDEVVHVGSLVLSPACKVVFDLLPSDRINGGA